MVQIGATNTSGPGDSTETRGPEINAANWVLVGLSALFVGLRLYSKRLRRRHLWWDDWIVVAAWVCSVYILIPEREFALMVVHKVLMTSDIIIITVSIAQGFGKHIYAIPPDHLSTIGLLGNIAATLTILSETFSKTSFAVTLLRLTEGRVKKFVWACIISSNLVMVTSALLHWVQCQPSEKSWKPQVAGTCTRPEISSSLAIAFAAYSGVLDLTLALLPWKIIFSLRMRLKEKIAIAVAMSMGILAGITSFIKCAFITKLNGKDFTCVIKMVVHKLISKSDHGAPLVIWGNAESAITIIAASIPLLRALVVEVRTSSSRRYALDKGSLSGEIAGTSQVCTTASRNETTQQSSAGGGEACKRPGITLSRMITVTRHDRGTFLDESEGY
ncbi:hypothetical protein jhhlp_008399 [Lomentospora prolificans]|uniref:Rhodopsin domain-containing protein n=1 Tax=Lomentospora prolificans TaxID=41688 RepID=A0A2N3MXY1_9PEZI|nr:hypothetical protein jhhlp_008399 [Lomentospora prolificans]